MKKTLILVMVAVLALSAMGMTFAAPNERAERVNTGECTDVNREANYARKIEMLQALVAEGKLTQAEVDTLLLELENCDGSQRKVLRDFFEEKFGEGSGIGQMKGYGGRGRGTGAGKCGARL